MATVVIRHGALGPAAPLGPRPGWQEDDPYGVRTKAPANTPPSDDPQPGAVPLFPDVALLSGRSAVAGRGGAVASFSHAGDVSAETTDGWGHAAGGLLNARSPVDRPIGQHADGYPPQDLATGSGRVAAGSRGPVGVRVAVWLMELAVVGYVVGRLAVAAFTTPVGGAEAATIAQAAARARGTGGQGGWSFDGVLAGWLSVSGALARHAGAAAAVREAVLVAAAVTVVLVWILAGRLRLTAPARVVALIILGGTPTAAHLLAGQARAGVLAAVFVAFAAVLVAGEHAGVLPRVVALGALVVGLVLAPVALPAVLVTVAALVWQGSVGIRVPEPARRGIAGVLVLVAATSYAAIGIVDLGWVLDTRAVALPGPPLGVWLLVIVLGLLIVLALTDRWLRAPAAGLLVLVATAVIAPGGARLNALMVALPVAAVVAAGCADDLTAGSRLRRRAIGDSRYTRKNAALIASLALGVVVLAGLGGVATYRGRPAALPVAAVSPVAAWIRDQLPAGTPVSVDDAVAPDLIRAGLPAAQVRTGAAWRVSAEAPDSFVAAFGEGNRRLWITGPSTLSTASGLGTQLAANGHLTLTGDAADALRDGVVDERVLLVIADLAGQHTFGIADFPAVTGETFGNPKLRQVRITSVDGRPAGDAGAFTLVQHWLDQQLNPYRPAAVVRSAEGVLVRYPLVAEGPR